MNGASEQQNNGVVKNKSENIVKMSLSNNHLNGLFQFSKITLDKSKESSKSSPIEMDEREDTTVNKSVIIQESSKVTNGKNQQKGNFLHVVLIPILLGNFSMGIITFYNNCIKLTIIYVLHFIGP